MFEGLKKRLSNFMGSVAGKEKENLGQQETHAAEKPANQPTAIDKGSRVHHAAIQKQEYKEDKTAKAPQHQEKETRQGTGLQQHVEKAAQEQQAERENPYLHRNAKPEQRKPDVGAAAKIKGMILGNVRLKENDIEPFIEALKIGLLESDVNYEVAEKLSENIKRDMLSRDISSKNIDNEIRMRFTKTG